MVVRYYCTPKYYKGWGYIVVIAAEDFINKTEQELKECEKDVGWSGFYPITIADYSCTNRGIIMSVHNPPLLDTHIHRWMKGTAVLIRSSCQGMRVESIGAQEESRNSELNSFWGGIKCVTKCCSLEDIRAIIYLPGIIHKSFKL